VLDDTFEFCIEPLRESVARVSLILLGPAQTTEMWRPINAPEPYGRGTVGAIAAFSFNQLPADASTAVTRIRIQSGTQIKSTTSFEFHLTFVGTNRHIQTEDPGVDARKVHISEDSARLSLTGTKGALSSVQIKRSTCRALRLTQRHRCVLRVFGL
jgi:hypothetical protein